MLKSIVLSLLSFCCLALSYGQSEAEFSALVSLYYSTGGPQWAKPWDLGQPVSGWEGVVLEEGHVVELHLPLNRLSGHLPENFYQLPYLRVLNLAYNELEGQLSSRWKKLQSLEEIQLRQNKFTGPIPAGLRKMKSLKSLFLADNGFTDYRGLLEIREGQLRSFDLLAPGGQVPQQLRSQLSNTLFADEE